MPRSGAARLTPGWRSRSRCSRPLCICKVKDDNIVQAMQQAQADKINHWSSSGAQYSPGDRAGSQAASRQGRGGVNSPGGQRARLVDRPLPLVADQAAKKDSLPRAGRRSVHLDALNFRDDQLICRIAIAPPFHARPHAHPQRWLYGSRWSRRRDVLMGVAGLRRRVHPRRDHKTALVIGPARRLSLSTR